MAQVAQQPLWGHRERSDRSPQRGGRFPQLHRAPIPQALMRALPVIPVKPDLHLGPGLAQGMEQFGMEEVAGQNPYFLTS